MINLGKHTITHDILQARLSFFIYQPKFSYFDEAEDKVFADLHLCDNEFVSCNEQVHPFHFWKFCLKSPWL